MDPNATLEWIEDAINDGDDPSDLVEALRDWMHSGGFPPKWEDYPRAARLFGVKAKKSFHYLRNWAVVCSDCIGLLDRTRDQVGDITDEFNEQQPVVCIRCGSVRP